MPFLHGVETIEQTSGVRPVRTVRTAVIGLVGTAPTWAVAAADRTLNKPVLITSAQDAARYFGPEIAGYTIPQALRAILAQGRGAVIVVNVFDPAVHKVAVVAAPFVLDANDTVTLPHAGVSGLVVKNQAASVTYVLDVDYTFDVLTSKVVRKAGGAILAGATLTINYNRADPTVPTGTEVIGAVDGSGVRSGLQALLNAGSEIGFSPKVLIAPGFSSSVAVSNAMEALAPTLRAIALLDAPAGTTVAAAIAGRAAAGALNFFRTSERSILCYPYVRALDRAGVEHLEPLSQHVAGAIAESDEARGYWFSVSNRALAAVVGLERALTFAFNDPNSEVNRLNEVGILTVANVSGEFRIWGNRSAAFPASVLPQTFMAVRRTADLMIDELNRVFVGYIDRPINAALLDAVIGEVNRFIRTQIGLGALVDGACHFDPADNSEAEIAAGHLTFSLEYMPATPAERITLKAVINTDLLKALTAQVI